MVELEDIVARKNYVLKIDWSCRNCGKRTKLVGCVLKGEKYYDDKKSQVSWEDILHKRCKACNLTERPFVVCDKCKTTYPFGQLGCETCNIEIELVINIQDDLAILREQIRQDKRRKTDTTELEESYRLLELRVTKLGYHQCSECVEEYTEASVCFECRKIDGE